MAKEKVDLSRLTINQLQELTGSSYRTIKKRLAPIDPIEKTGNSLFYDPKIALPLIFETQESSADEVEIPRDPDGKPLFADVEAAKLSRARTIKLEIETEVLRRSLIPASEVERTWSDLIMAFRSRVLGIPSRVGPQLVGQDLKKIELTLKTLLKESLQELSEYAPADDESVDSESSSEGSEESRAPAGPDDNAMGGQISEA